MGPLASDGSPRLGGSLGPGGPPRPDGSSGPGPSLRPGEVEALIREVAARQHGVVARAQLLQAGAPTHAVDFHLRKGRLEPLHRGVYRAGPVVGPLHREWAALLACSGATAGGRSPDTIRPGLALSHRTAAGLWGLLPTPPPHRAVEVTGPRSLRPRSGVRLHRVARLEPDEVARRNGLPLTTPARTLVDLAAEADAAELERAVARGGRERLLSPDALRQALAAHRRRPGARVLRRLLDGVVEPELTRSTAEARLLELVRRGGLPRPRVNAVVEGREVDFLWSGPRLVVEVDGFAHHRGRAAFERDRGRDQALTAAGYRVVRVTWRQLDRRPSQVLVRLAQALARGV